MRNFVRLLVFGLFIVPSIGAEPPQQGSGPDLSWAFPVPDKDQPPAIDDGKPIQVPGSSKIYTRKQMEGRYNVPDWFPDEHAPMPQIVQRGREPNVGACAKCHLTSGLGHPESANLAGQPAAFLERQIEAFKSGTRKNGGIMAEYGKALSEDESRQANEWFAALKPSAWVKIVETDTVPKTYVNEINMRVPRPEAGTEPLGNRIIEVPLDVARTMSDDPHSGTVAYVPIGSIAKGEKLVTTGDAGKTIACAVCHGESLMGLAEVPRIAGLSPLYITRALYNYKGGTTPGTWSDLMKAPVAHLDYDDIVSIAAYLASRGVSSAPVDVGANPAPAANSAGAANTGATGATGDSLLARGKTLFGNYRCYDCHGMNGEGTDDGPDLIGTLLNADQIASFLQKPSADAKTRGMPDFAAGSPEIAPLVAYVLSLKQSQGK